MALHLDYNIVNGASVANTVLSKPSGTTAGKILLATGHVEADAIIAPPVGWAHLIDIAHSATTVVQRIFWKRAGSNEPASYTFVHTSTWRAGYIVAVDEASIYVNPIVGAPNQSTGSSWTALGVDAPSDLSWIGLWTSAFDDLNILTAPSGFTPRANAGTNIFTADRTKATAGPTGDVTGNFSASQQWSSVQTVVADDAYTVPHPNVTHSTSEVGTSLGAANAMPLPDDCAIGDFVIYIAANDSTSSTNMSGSTGWASSAREGTNAMESMVFARVLTGLTGDNILSVTGAAQDYAVVGLRIPAVMHSVTDAAAWMATHVASTNGGSGAINPPSLAPGSSKDYLWIAAGTLDMGGTGDLITLDPTNYSNLAFVRSAASTSAVALRVAQRQLTAASEDPGTFTNTSRAWQGWTIAVPPYAAVTPPTLPVIKLKTAGVFQEHSIKTKIAGAFNG